MSWYAQNNAIDHAERYIECVKDQIEDGDPINVVDAIVAVAEEFPCEGEPCFIACDLHTMASCLTTSGLSASDGAEASRQLSDLLLLMGLYGDFEDAILGDAYQEATAAFDRFLLASAIQQLGTAA